MFPSQEMVGDDPLVISLSASEISAADNSSNTENSSLSRLSSNNTQSSLSSSVFHQSPVSSHHSEFRFARPIRQKSISNKFKDFVGLPPHMAHSVFSHNYQPFIAKVAKISEPYSYQQAVKSPEYGALLWQLS